MSNKSNFNFTSQTHTFLEVLKPFYVIPICYLQKGIKNPIPPNNIEGKRKENKIQIVKYLLLD